VLNNLLVNQALRFDAVVDNAMVLYDTLNRCLGKTIANKIIERTIGRVFTAGANLSQLERTMEERGQGMRFMLDYCSEALEGLENHEEVNQESIEVLRPEQPSLPKHRIGLR
jgi:proline dehydrogenase